MTHYDWDFFIAHAGPDKPKAEELYELLKDRARVFLDSRSIELGDDWDATIQAAQKASFISIVLVSANSGKAYYERIEIATAISMARKANERHRVVPVFLETSPSAEDDPYGLGLKHGLLISDEHPLSAAASRLLALVETLKPAGHAGMPHFAGAIGGAGVLWQPPLDWTSPVITNPWRFKLVAFDFDGTLLRGENFDFSWEVVWKRLGFHLGIQQDLRRGYRLQTDKDSTRSARVAAYRKWCDQAVAAYRSRRVTRSQLRDFCRPLALTKNCREALTLLREAGMVTAIISGGINTFIEDTFPDYRNFFDFVFVNELVFSDDGALVGVHASEFDFQGKAEALDLISARIGSTPGEAVFIGDHFNDEAVMLRVDLAIAYPPKDAVVEDVLHEAIHDDDLVQVLQHIFVV